MKNEINNEIQTKKINATELNILFDDIDETLENIIRYTECENLTEKDKLKLINLQYRISEIGDQIYLIKGIK